MAYHPSYHHQQNNYPPPIPGANYNATNYVPTVPNYVSTALTINSPTSMVMMNPDAMMKMFHEYKESCRIRINSCGDNDKLKITSLESMVTELLEQNELLLNSLIEMNQNNQNQRSKDSLLTSTSSFSSAYSSASSAASFDSPAYPMAAMMAPCPSNNYGHQQHFMPNNLCTSGAGVQQKNTNGSRSSTPSSAARSQKFGKGAKDAPKDAKCESCDGYKDKITELKLNNDQIKSENAILITENDNYKITNERLISTNKQLEEEVADLRAENDNLRHDMSNLVQIINQRDVEDDGNRAKSGAKRRDDNLMEHLTFCDSISPEDVYGPIESLKDLELSDSEFDAKAKEDASKRFEDAKSKFSSERPCSTTVKRPSQSLNCSPSHNKAIKNTNSQLILLMEEKESLINRLQQHLEEVTKQLNIRDEVIKKIEDKLSAKRKECQEWLNNSTELETKLNESTKKYLDLKARELTLIEDKRDLMSKLNQESDACIEMKENFLIIKKQLHEVIKQNQYQNMTIEHLKEALVSTKNSCSNLQQTPTYNYMSYMTGYAPGLASTASSGNQMSSSTSATSVTSASNTAFGLVNYDHDHPKTVINKSTPHLPSNNCPNNSSKTSSFKLDHV